MLLAGQCCGLAAPGYINPYSYYAGTNIVLTTNGVRVSINSTAIAGEGTGDLKADGSVPMTGDLDLGGNDLLNVGSLSITGTGASYFDSIYITNTLGFNQSANEFITDATNFVADLTGFPIDLSTKPPRITLLSCTPLMLLLDVGAFS